jgi:NitT/TauT family transport system substrate-binding protein
MSKIFVASGLFFLSMALTVCGQEIIPQASAPSEEFVSISLPMGYIPDPQYAPFYVAAENGYFADAGLEVEFDYSFETDGVALVGAGERPFAIVSGEQVLLARAQGLPVVYVFEWFQQFPIALVSKAGAGIEAPADLVGRNVGLPYLGLLSANGIAPEDVNANDIGFTQIESLLADQSEAVVGYANNEPVQLTGMGEDINMLYVADYIDMVANGIITNEETMATNPAMVKGFTRALLRGLQFTLDNPEEAYEISKAYVEGLDDSRMPVLQASLPLWQADVLGSTDLASWQNTQEILLQAGLLDAPVADLEAAFTNEFVTFPQPE